MIRFKGAVLLSSFCALGALVWPSLVHGENILCVNPVDQGCHATIQSAVDVASPGDVILIAPHPDATGYTENVVIATSGLTLRGDTVAPAANLFEQVCPQVVLDGCETPEALVTLSTCGAVSIAVGASDTVIERILLRHGRIVFGPGSERSVLSESCVIGTRTNPVRSNGPVNDLQITRTVFQGGDSHSIDLQGDNIKVRHNQLYAVDNGIRIWGDDMQVAFNTIRACNDQCLILEGNDAWVEGNLLVGGDDGLYITGDNPTVIHNVVEHFTDLNLRVTCTNPCSGGVVSGNRVVSNDDDDDLIRIDLADRFIVEDNWLAFSSEKGLDFRGRDSQIRRNTIYRAGSENAGESCLMISEIDNIGGGNLIEDNRFLLCTMNGIRQAGGDQNIYRNNEIIGAGLVGIRVDGGVGTRIEGNQISGSHGEGISNRSGAVDTVIINNVLTANRVDFCNTGSIADFSGNSFATECAVTD